MFNRTLTRVILAALIAGMLGGAYLIVAKNQASTGSAKQEIPSGFMH